VTSSGNALVGAYLNKIGLPYSAVIYITSAAPDSISWLNKPDAEKLGIEVSLFNTTAAANPKGRAIAPATGASEVSPPAGPSTLNAPPPTGRLVLPTAISPRYSTENEGKARMHTCVDQYNANKATNANGGLKWIEWGGGYYSECNKKLKGQNAEN
jgi:hypothetical protein